MIASFQHDEPPWPGTSYAQLHEDVILWHVLGGIREGFYIDIGAQDPVIDSMSLLFYEQGWRGIHVEPVALYADRLWQARPDETVIQAAIGMHEGTIPFWEIPGTGLSTGHAGFAAAHDARDARKTVPTEVSCMRLSTLLTSVGDREIGWLKIDAEGMEHDIIESWGSHPTRPYVLILESTEPNTDVPNYQSWEPLLFARGYDFAYRDKLNRYYVHGSRPDIKAAFEPEVLAELVARAEDQRRAGTA